jgi:CheY-like chemotaxis protein
VTDISEKRGARIVVIEDNPADVLLLRIALDERGEPYDLVVLSDGEQALAYIAEHARTSAPDPCAVVLDLHLPRYDGLAVLKALRASPELSHVRVAILTSAASPREEAELKNFGVNLYRQKPLMIEEFMHLGGEILALCADEQAVGAAI